MRRFLLGSLLLLSCEARPPVGPAAPQVDGVEGHGGIAITGPSVPPVAAPVPEPRPPETASEEATAARELYLQGYQLKDSDPKAAAARFRQVVALTPRGSVNHEKARSRLAELGEPPPP